MWQNIGYGLIALGVLALIGWGARGFFLAAEIPVFIRIAVGVIGAGALILLGIAIRDRRRKKDDFKEVEH